MNGTLGQNIKSFASFTTADVLPPPEYGIHGWIFGRAKFLQRQGIPMDDAVRLIEEKAAGSVLRRPLQPEEVSNSVANAYSDTTDTKQNPLGRFKYEPPLFGEGWPPQMRMPHLSGDREAISKALKTVGSWSLSDIREASPVPTDGKPSGRSTGNAL